MMKSRRGMNEYSIRLLIERISPRREEKEKKMCSIGEKGNQKKQCRITFLPRHYDLNLITPFPRHLMQVNHRTRRRRRRRASIYVLTSFIKIFFQQKFDGKRKKDLHELIISQEKFCCALRSDEHLIQSKYLILHDYFQQTFSSEKERKDTLVSAFFNYPKKIIIFFHFPPLDFFNLCKRFASNAGREREAKNNCLFAIQAHR